jgi:hypothetical protein
MHQVGSLVALNLTVRNKVGNQAASRVKLLLTFKGFAIVGFKSPGLVCRPAKAQVLCTVAFLPAGRQVSGRVVVRVAATGALPIILSVKSQATDANGADNKVSQTIVSKTRPVAKSARTR